MKYRYPSHVLFEAIIIGVLNFVIFTTLKQLTNIPTSMKLFLCGALIHILFEILGANEWWCLSTYK
jgi:hypothetical protein